jgi:hypothetical protein
MIKFFRKIRLELLNQNKMSKYFKYAIGEIILVVIGILIALSINNWNTKRLQSIKEVNYLKEIKSNLEQDLISTKIVLDYNTTKENAIDSVFAVFAETSDPNKYMFKVANHMNTLTSYQIFEPIRIAFQNMVSSENIDLISDADLRKSLSMYYNRDFASGTQERIKEKTRKFGDEVPPYIFNKQLFKSIMNYDSKIQDMNDIKVHESSEIYASLFTMRVNINAQNQLINETVKEINKLLKLTNNYLGLE